MRPPCIDAHGDEGLAYNFFASAQGVDGWTSRLANFYNLFQNIYCDVTPDFQKVYGYEFAPGQDKPGAGAGLGHAGVVGTPPRLRSASNASR